MSKFIVVLRPSDSHKSTFTKNVSINTIAVGGPPLDPDLQFGSRVQHGVAQYLKHADVLAKQTPHLAFVAVDVENVFGNVSRGFVGMQCVQQIRGWKGLLLSSGAVDSTI